MGRMKDLFITIHNGGDEAVRAATELAGTQWISASERLPPLMAEVLGWHPEDRVRAWFRHSGQPKNAPYWEMWSPQDRECDDCNVEAPTHWMTMPEPPLFQDRQPG